ncbi:hypothetical protein K488DRAFT_82854 [Vararia minispora EC-137]|uniref:Uncharacterized protein n=1 Tax=Vararia minispora EC-137 TaxID=1314806 RepID=A0ACB8QVG5_9AGAM|nr:hypothetical protein K488DRAFT_82854 [Vararia minispora EC-137]
MSKRSKTKPRTSTSSPRLENPDDSLVIADQEQWRLIQESGILKKASDVYKARPSTDPLNGSTSGPSAQDDEVNPLFEEIFQSIVIAMPLSFLLLLLHILVHIQYQQRPDYWYIANRMVTSVPLIGVAVFYVNRHKNKKSIQLALLAISFAAGTRSIWLVNNANWRIVMQQTPPLGAAWVYTIVALDLVPAVVALLGVGAWTYWAGMSIVFR